MYDLPPRDAGTIPWGATAESTDDLALLDARTPSQDNLRRVRKLRQRPRVGSHAAPCMRQAPARDMGIATEQLRNCESLLPSAAEPSALLIRRLSQYSRLEFKAK